MTYQKINCSGSLQSFQYFQLYIFYESGLVISYNLSQSENLTADTTSYLLDRWNNQMFD